MSSVREQQKNVSWAVIGYGKVQRQQFLSHKGPSPMFDCSAVARVWTLFSAEFSAFPFLVQNNVYINVCLRHNVYLYLPVWSQTSWVLITNTCFKQWQSFCKKYLWNSLEYFCLIFIAVAAFLWLIVKDADLYWKGIKGQRLKNNPKSKWTLKYVSSYFPVSRQPASGPGLLICASRDSYPLLVFPISVLVFHRSSSVEFR